MSNARGEVADGRLHASHPCQAEPAAADRRARSRAVAPLAQQLGARVDPAKPTDVAHDHLPRVFLYQASGGQFLQARNEPEKAEVAYQRGLELDPLAESVYRNLMTVQARRGRRAEALETYRRCRHMLPVVPGIAPSSETEAIHRVVLEQA